MRKNYVVQMTVAAALLGITIVTAACSSEQSQDPADTVIKDHTITPTTQPPANSQVNSSSPTPGSEIPVTDPTATPGSGSNNEQGVQQGKHVATSSDQPVAEDKITESPIQPYTVNKPALKGISINDNIAVVTQLAGKPIDEYYMDDEMDPIQIHEYKGYIVGFNKLGKVQFVEITSKDIETGLNGFRLGSNVKDAQKALGKPDMSSKYALSYKNDGTILKLDVDPVTQNCLSIKLFAESK
jgi:hypothetical protein